MLPVPLNIMSAEIFSVWVSCMLIPPAWCGATVSEEDTLDLV